MSGFYRGNWNGNKKALLFLFLVYQRIQLEKLKLEVCLYETAFRNLFGAITHVAADVFDLGWYIIIGRGDQVVCMLEMFISGMLNFDETKILVIYNYSMLEIYFQKHN
jgi:hypothetical protein